MSAATGEAAALEAAQRRQEHEEEEVTLMHSKPSGEFEYKIILSATGVFKVPIRFKAALEEEARAGWELLEKLDKSRVRLRRLIECRRTDAEFCQDPYRTRVGISEVQAIGVVVGVIVGGLALLFGVCALLW